MYKINWISVCIINLLIVGILGTLMRYKICYELTSLDQRFLLHAHSHFAFSGWVSQALMVSILAVMRKKIEPNRWERYNGILFLNLMCAYAMLISFASFGYNVLSIVFSSASIVIFVAYASMMHRDLKQSREISRPWFSAALLFYLLSCVGTISLSYIMATKSYDQNLYLSSVYWYLHFQYNGWFFFACAGLFLHWLKDNEGLKSYDRRVIQIFAWSCIPAYGLSVLWLHLPPWIFIIVALASIAQFTAWVKMLMMVNVKVVKSKVNSFGMILLLLIALAFSTKFILQLGSTIPAISKLAFGFRSIVIAYLHLVLLACISLFLITYFYITHQFKENRYVSIGIGIFVFGIFLNEFFLGVEGIASFSYTVVPKINQLLLLCAIVMVTGLIILNFFNRKKSAKKLV